MFPLKHTHFSGLSRLHGKVSKKTAGGIRG